MSSSCIYVETRAGCERDLARALLLARLAWWRLAGRCSCHHRVLAIGRGHSRPRDKKQDEGVANVKASLTKGRDGTTMSRPRSLLRAGFLHLWISSSLDVSCIRRVSVKLSIVHRDPGNA